MKDIILKSLYLIIIQGSIYNLGYYLEKFKYK